MKDIYDYLKKSGVYPGHKGFLYLAHVIDYAIKNPGANLSDCYDYTAASCSASRTTVCGDIRYALDASQTDAEGKKPKKFISEAVFSISHP